jgi:predicted nucleic acid-binding protein
MSLYIVDASVAVKWFLPEPYTDAASRLCHPDYQLHVPALFDLEFSNIVCKKIRLSGNLRCWLLASMFLIIK